jgi:hypothetical protein
MIDIYETWISDFGDRRLPDRHDEARQRRVLAAVRPEVLRYAREQGKREFFMFGEVFDTTQALHVALHDHDEMQAVLDFPFQAAARDFAASSAPTSARDFFADDDWYTDADSNVYQLPTFLGNHDMGRIGSSSSRQRRRRRRRAARARPARARADVLLARQPGRLLRRRAGLHRRRRRPAARQDMFPSRVADYNDDDLIGTDATHGAGNFDPTHPLYARSPRCASSRRSIRRCATAPSSTALRAGGRASTRSRASDRAQQREYVVALNNSESDKTAEVPTYSAGMRVQPHLRHGRRGHLDHERLRSG